MNSSTPLRAQATGSSDTDRSKKSNCPWTFLNIGLMVVGFWLFWPIGLLVLFSLLAGIRPLDLPERLIKWSKSMKDQISNPFGGASTSSGNRVFDEYQEAQLDRIEEIKNEVKMRAERFDTFKSEEERHQDQKQFARFMGRPDDKRPNDN